VFVWKDNIKVEAFSGKLGYAKIFNAEFVALAVALGVVRGER